MKRVFHYCAQKQVSSGVIDVRHGVVLSDSDPFSAEFINEIEAAIYADVTGTGANYIVYYGG